MNNWEKNVLTKLKEILGLIDSILNEIEKIDTTLNKLSKKTT